ncbi:hypothetical protein ACMTAU_18675, partial [Alcaligenes pakistanensis]
NSRKTVKRRAWVRAAFTMFTALPELDDAFKKGGWIIHPAWRIAIEARFFTGLCFPDLDTSIIQSLLAVFASMSPSPCPVRKKWQGFVPFTVRDRV